MNEKTCTRCGEKKPTSEFYRRSDRPLGVQPHCKSCDKSRVRKYQISEHGNKTLLHYSRTERVKKMRRKWRTSPNGKISNRNYMRRKRARDVGFRIACSLRARIWKSLRSQRVKKSSRTSTLLGCTIDSFKIYLESLFEVGMSWDNYGTAWHIDHIIPCALFDLTNLDHQKRCFHVSNMQPMWAVENLRKGCRVIS